VALLSARESEVLNLLTEGNSNPEIARVLTLSTRTVDRHVQNLYRKLGVRNRVAAANWAREHGQRRPRA
jgi:DNA-binding NarL/FixJ family response regulator